MNIHEYQAKDLLRQYHILTPKGVLIDDISQVKQACKTLGGETLVVKAQIHAGARGKGGGVVVCREVASVIATAKKLLNINLVTPQTTEQGLPVNFLLLEQGQAIEQELYLSLLVDRSTKTIAIIASTQGGMDIEQVASMHPEAIIKLHINPCVGLQDYQIRQLGFALKLETLLLKDFGAMVKQLYQLLIDKDLSLLEVNPLVITKDNQLIALDAKINCEDNALYRHHDLLLLKDKTQGDIYEQIAQENKLSYIALEGNIGCMVNGAGLAMATMDLIDYYGGLPANFLDVGGGTTSERVAKALEIILSGQTVRAILINIFGGIVRCDLIAQGILQAMQALGGSPVPMVVRLEGTNAQIGLDLLDKSQYDIHTELDLIKATKIVISLADNTTLKNKI